MERCLYFLQVLIFLLEYLQPLFIVNIYQLLEKKGLLSLSKDHSYVKLLSVAEVNEDNYKKNDLLCQLRTKGLKLIGEWNDMDESENSGRTSSKTEENEDESI